MVKQLGGGVDFLICKLNFLILKQGPADIVSLLWNYLVGGGGGSQLRE